jgi:hypothetical protein
MRNMQTAVNGATELKIREKRNKKQIEELEAKDKSKLSREAI